MDDNTTVLDFVFMIVAAWWVILFITMFYPREGFWIMKQICHAFREAKMVG